MNRVGGGWQCLEKSFADGVDKPLTNRVGGGWQCLEKELDLRMKA